MRDRSKRRMFGWFSLSINQLLIISHLFLVLFLISALSFSRYQSEWTLSINHAVSNAENSIEQHIILLSTLVAGRNYANFMLPAVEELMYSKEELILLDIQGVSDYQHQPVHVRYLREEQNVWRENITQAEVRALEMEKERIERLISDSDSNDATLRAKLIYVLGQAEGDYQSAKESFELKTKYDASWFQPDFGGQEYWWDIDNKLLHILIPLRNDNGGQVWGVFDASELADIKDKLLLDVLEEAVVAVLVSLLIIVFSTRHLIRPLKNLSRHMTRDVTKIVLKEIEERHRRDEIGDLAKTFSKHVVKINHQMKELKDKSDIDALSGLGSRYRYVSHAEQYLKQAMAEQQNFALIVLDIDNFKLFNDTYGHGQGDEVITRVAQAIKSTAPSDAECYRIGGEEFVVQMRSGSLEEFVQSAQSIIDTVCALNIPHSKNLPYGVVTISSGMTYLLSNSRQEDESENELNEGEQAPLFSSIFNTADKLLYRAKGNGRNRLEHDNI